MLDHIFQIFAMALGEIAAAYTMDRARDMDFFWVSWHQDGLFLGEVVWQGYFRGKP